MFLVTPNIISESEDHHGLGWRCQTSRKENVNRMQYITLDVRKYPFGKIVSLHQNPLQVGKKHQHCWENHIRTTTKTLEVRRLFCEWFFQKDFYFTRDCKNLHLIVNWWFGLVVWIPGIWMGSLLVTLIESQTTNPNHQFVISWLTYRDKITTKMEAQVHVMPGSLISQSLLKSAEKKQEITLEKSGKKATQFAGIPKHQIISYSSADSMVCSSFFSVGIFCCRQQSISITYLVFYAYLPAWLRKRRKRETPMKTNFTWVQNAAMHDNIVTLYIYIHNMHII